MQVQVAGDLDAIAGEQPATRPVHEGLQEHHDGLWAADRVEDAHRSWTTGR